MSNQEFPNQPQAPKSVEEQANYEGNETILLFERLADPVIFNQIIDLYYRAGQSQKGKTMSIHKKDKDGKLLYDEKGAPVIVTGIFIPPTKEIIENERRGVIEEVGRDTPIGFNLEDESNANGEREFVAINQGLENQGRMTVRQRGIVEAHEKGHKIRYYKGEFFNKLFSGVLEKSLISKFLLSRESYELKRAILVNEGKNNVPTFDEGKRKIEEYILTPREITERMSQLKNYFGMRGHEEFTKAHLDYAREHYLKDTGMDNNMYIFLGLITAGTEKKFLKLINSVGI